jgi:molybdopterin-guanine dinucleotide biosynthesis adapter protein
MKTIKQEFSLKELERMVPDADIVIHEGFKKGAVNKIEVFRHGVSGNQPLCMEDASFLALVSDRPFDVCIPRYDLNDANGVAEFLIKKIGGT